MRWNNQGPFPISDFHLNAFLNLIDKGSFLSLAVAPMTIQMTTVIPDCIEASMFAIVTACIEFSSDWAGEIIGAIFCNAFGITTKDMSNYPKAILVKVGLLLFVI